MTFLPTGTTTQQALVTRALDRCTFPFERLTPSLEAEGRQDIRVDWEDLSSRAATDTAPHDDTMHTIVRDVDGRARVLGLFYLPPYTRVVLDVSLEQSPDLAQEVFLAEAAHAVDYHFMTTDHRRGIVNFLHDEDLPPGHPTTDGTPFTLDGHTCSWFDVGPYGWWCGEAFMEAFIEAFSDVRVTIQLNHPTTPEVAAAVRDLLVPPPAVEPSRTASAALQPCELYVDHGSSTPAITQGHHVLPLYLQQRKHGAIVDKTLTWLCGTCHDSVHAWLYWLMGERAKPDPVPPPRARRLAQEAHDWYLAP